MATEPCVAFVSYAREDREFVLKVAEALRIQGIVVHGDWELAGGEDYEDQLRALIVDADTLLFFIAPESAGSPGCMKELAIAGDQGKRIVPVLRRNVPDAAALPTALRTPQWLFLRAGDDFVEGIRELGRALNTDPELLPEHRRLAVASDNWDRAGRNRGYLLHGAELEEAERWLARTTAATPRLPQPTALQSAFILASQERRRRMTRWTLIGAGVVIAALAGLAGVAEQQRRTAERRRIVAEAARLVAEANLLRARHVSLFQRAVLLTLEAERRSPSMEATQALLEVSTLLRPPLASFRHDHPVRSVAFSRDGDSVAAATLDGAVHLWSIATGKEAGGLGSDADARSVTFGSDDGHVITDGHDRRAHSWDLKTGKEVAAWQHKGTFAVSRDGRYAATVIDGEVRVAPPGGEVAQRLPMHGYPVQVALSEDGSHVATANADGLVEIWNTGKELPGFGSAEHTYESDIKALQFSPDGHWLAAGSQDGVARLWDTTRGAEVTRFEHGDAILGLAFSGDGSILATAGRDGTVRLWALATRQEVGRLAHEDAVHAVAFSADGKRIATASEDKTVRLWALEGETRTFTHDSDIADVVFTPDGRSVVAASADGGTWASSLTDGDGAGPRKLTEQQSTVWSLALSSDGLYLATASDEDGTARIWRLSDAVEVARIACDGPALTVAFSPDGKTLATSGKDGTVRVSTVPRGEEIARFRHDALVQDVAFDPSGRLVASASEDGTARVWDVRAKRELLRVAHDDSAVATGVAFSPDGKLLATAGSDSTARLWRIPGGQPMARIGNEGMGYRVAFSPDGRYLATASADGTARVWDIASQAEVARLTPSATVERIAFSPTGSQLVITAGDRTARVWQWQPEDVRSEVCARLTRNLTEAEWRQYLGNEPYHRTCENLP